MYAAVVKLTIDTERAPAAAAAFSNDILPRVQAAGFVGGDPGVALASMLTCGGGRPVITENPKAPTIV
jgi:hypothetical protein